MYTDGKHLSSDTAQWAHSFSASWIGDGKTSSLILSSNQQKKKTALQRAPINGVTKAAATTTLTTFIRSIRTNQQPGYYPYTLKKPWYHYHQQHYHHDHETRSYTCRYCSSSRSFLALDGRLGCRNWIVRVRFVLRRYCRYLHGRWKRIRPGNIWRGSHHLWFP